MCSSHIHLARDTVAGLDIPTSMSARRSVSMAKLSCIIANSTAFICLVIVISAKAQLAGGTISGTVTDPSAAVIPGAEVKIRNVATGVTRTTASNEKGFYSAANFLPGTYQLAI